MVTALAKLKETLSPRGSLTRDSPRGGTPKTPQSRPASMSHKSVIRLQDDDEPEHSSVTSEEAGSPEYTGPEEMVAKAAVRKCEAFPIESDKVGADKFVKLKRIGKGAIGTVYLARLKLEAEGQPVDESKPPKIYAIKVVTKDEMVKKNKVGRVMTEREVLATTSHPFVVKMYASFQTTNKLYYCMEYMAGGEFYRMLQAQPEKRIGEEQARFYGAEVVSALEYLHAMGFVYRDLKPENVLLRGDGHLALSDFDLSKQATAQVAQVVEKKSSVFNKKRGNSKLDLLDIQAQGPVFEGDAKSFVGTAEYLSPEVLSGEQQTAAVDWWTLGVLVYEMIFGQTPFKGSAQDATFQNIMQKDLKFPADVQVSKECKDFLKRLLSKDPKKRLGSNGGASEIRNHKWFSEINWALLLESEPPIVPGLQLPDNWAQMDVTIEKLDKSSGETSGTNAFENFNAVTQ